MEEEVKTPEYEYDLSSMPTTSKIVEAHQEGNWLIGVTDLGVRFRHHIPQGKRLNKKGDNFVLEDMVVGQGSPKQTILLSSLANGSLT